MKPIQYAIDLLCLSFALIFLSFPVLHAQQNLDDMFAVALDLAQNQNNEQKADSINQEAIALAEATLDDQKVYNAYQAYLSRDKYGNIPTIPLSYLNRALTVAEEADDSKKRFKMWIKVAKHMLSHDIKKASELSNRALSYASASSDPEIKILAYLSSARSARYNNRIKEAWQNLLNAQNILDKKVIRDSYEMQNQLYNESTEFHKKINNLKRAREVKQQQLNFIASAEPMDSLDYMWSLFDLSNLMISGKQTIRPDEKIKTILSWTKKSKNETLERYTKAFNYRYLVDNNKLASFYSQFEDEFKVLEDTTKKAEFCLGNALFCEHKQQIDSAKLFYQTAIEEASKGNNEYRLAYYYKLYGLFLNRNDLFDEAYDALQQSLALAQKKNYAPYILDVVDPLDDLAKRFNDYEAAYRFADIKNKTNALLADEQTKENLLIMELENDKKQNEYRQQSEAEKAKKKHDLQYLMIAVALLALFVILVLLSSMAVPVWLIDMVGFFSILFIFEFVILILDHKIHHWAHGEPIKIFLVKIAILSVLFPMHHVIEHGVISYMKRNKLLKRPEQGFFRNILQKLYPWLKKDGEEASH